MGSLRSLVHNPLAKKNKPKKFFWRSQLSLLITSVIHKEHPGSYLYVTLRNKDKNCMEIEWKNFFLNDKKGKKENEEIRQKISNMINAFSTKHLTHLDILKERNINMITVRKY
jgi:hypothetical protein